MATYTKPTSIPRWADTSANVVEPAEAKKDAGWVFEEIPPSSYENWRTKLNGEWWKWIDERLDDGTNNNYLRFTPQTAVESDVPIQPSSDGLTTLGVNSTRWAQGFFNEMEIGPSGVGTSLYTAFINTTDEAKTGPLQTRIDWATAGASTKIGIFTNLRDNVAAGSTTQGYGYYVRYDKDGAGTMDSFKSYRSLIEPTDGTITTAFNFASELGGTGGAITTLYHFHAEDPPGSLTIDDQYGLYVQNLTQATNNYGIWIDGASTYGIYVNASSPVRLEGGRLEVKRASADQGVALTHDGDYGVPATQSGIVSWSTENFAKPLNIHSTHVGVGALPTGGNLGFVFQLGARDATLYPMGRWGYQDASVTYEGFIVGPTSSLNATFPESICHLGQNARLLAASTGGGNANLYLADSGNELTNNLRLLYNTSVSSGEIRINDLDGMVIEAAGNFRPHSGFTGTFGTDTYPWDIYGGFVFAEREAEPVGRFTRRVTTTAGTLRNPLYVQTETTQTSYLAGFGTGIFFRFVYDGGDSVGAAIACTSDSGSGSDAGSLLLRTNSGGGITTRWTVRAAGALVPQTNGTYDIGASGQPIDQLYAERIRIENNAQANNLDYAWWSEREYDDDSFSVMHQSRLLRTDPTTSATYNVYPQLEYSGTGAHVGNMVNTLGLCNVTGTGATISNMYNFQASHSVATGSTLTEYIGFLSAAPTGGGATTNYYGHWVSAVGGGVTNAYGVYISNLTSGTAYGVYIVGATTAAIYVASGTSVFDNVEPLVNNTQDFGTTSKRWANVYAEDVFWGLPGQNARLFHDGTSAAVRFSTDGGNSQIQFNTSTKDFFFIEQGTTIAQWDSSLGRWLFDDVRPLTNSAYFLGTDSNRWDTTYTEDLEVGPSGSTSASYQAYIRSTAASGGALQTRYDLSGAASGTKSIAFMNYLDTSSSGTYDNLYGFYAYHNKDGASVVTSEKMFRAVIDIAAGTINNYYGFISESVTSGGVLANLYHFYVEDTTSTDQWGLYVENLTGGTNSNTGVHVEGAETAFKCGASVTTYALDCGLSSGGGIVNTGDITPQVLTTNKTIGFESTISRYAQISAAVGSFYRTDPPDPASAYDLCHRHGRNAIVCVAHVTASGTLRDNSWNVASVVRNAEGDYTITFDQAIDDDSTVSVNCFSNSGGELRSATYDINTGIADQGTSIRVRTYTVVSATTMPLGQSNANAAEVARDDSEFSLIIVGGPYTALNL